MKITLVFYWKVLYMHKCHLYGKINNQEYEIELSCQDYYAVTSKQFDISSRSFDKQTHQFMCNNS